MGIKSNSLTLVKERWRSANFAWRKGRLYLLTFLLSLMGCWVTSPSEAAPLPPIEAKSYGIRALDHSTSKRLYLFVPSGSLPQYGRILLLRKGAQNVMAFRVLKIYPDRKQFAAKRVRTYPNYPSLPPNSQFTAWEKIADKHFPQKAPPPPTAEDEADLLDLEQKPAFQESPSDFESDFESAPTADPFFDDAAMVAEPSDLPPIQGEFLKEGEELEIDELESGNFEFENADPSTEPEGQETSQAEVSGVSFEEAEASLTENKARNRLPSMDLDPHELEAERNLAVAMEEVYPMDTHRYGIGFQFGYFKNLSGLGDTNYFAGAGLRFSLQVGSMMFFDQASVQDSLSLDLGAFLYKIVNFTENASTHSLMPLTGTLRYTIYLTENYGIFFYGGATRTQVLSTAPGIDEALTQEATLALTAVGPAVGGGVVIRMGPHWESRIDLGTDMIGGGIVIRF